MNTTPAPTLAQTQHWLQTVITHPDGIAAGIDSAAARERIGVSSADVENVIPRSEALTGIERLQVYGNAYFARLIECLQSEFPALRAALGDDTFDGFAFGYLQAYPSRSYTLHDLSRDFPRYLEETRPAATADGSPDWADFLIDLARLERIYSEVFDGSGVEGQTLLDMSELQQVSPEVWPHARLRLVPCLRLETFRFPVHEYATAVRHHSTEAEIMIPAARETHLVITRREFVVRRFTVSPPQFALLSALRDGQTIAAAIASMVEATSADVDQLAQSLQNWFHDWSRARLFQSLDLPSE